MSKQPANDTAPTEPFLTCYDTSHLATYLRLLDADEEGADWREVASIVLELDVAKVPERARRSWASHLARAGWMTETGYRHLLRGRPAKLETEADAQASVSPPTNKKSNRRYATGICQTG